MHKVLFLLRVALGWLFFYAGITKLLDPTWSAAGYLNSAKTFPAFYHWLASPGLLPATNFINAWALTLLGALLLLGLFTRISALLLGAIMLLYYLPVLDFPMVAPHSYLVDEHIIYALILFYFAAGGARHIPGISKFWLGKF